MFIKNIFILLFCDFHMESIKGIECNIFSQLTFALISKLITYKMLIKNFLYIVLGIFI